MAFRLQGRFSHLWRQLSQLNNVVAAKLRIPAEWVPRIGVLIGLGFTMIQLNEYFVATCVWVVLACIWVIKAFRFGPVTQRQGLILVAKILHTLVAIAVGTGLIAWTNTTRGDKAWSNLTAGETDQQRIARQTFVVTDFTVESKLHIPGAVWGSMQHEPISEKLEEDSNALVSKALCIGPSGFKFFLMLVGDPTRLYPPNLEIQIVGQGKQGNCAITSYLAGIDEKGSHWLGIRTDIVELGKGFIVFRNRVIQHMLSDIGWKFPRYTLADFGRPEAESGLHLDVPQNDAELMYPVDSSTITAGEIERMEKATPRSIDVVVWPNPKQQGSLKSAWCLRPLFQGLNYSSDGTNMVFRFRRK